MFIESILLICHTKPTAWARLTLSAARLNPFGSTNISTKAELHNRDDLEFIKSHRS